MTAPFRSQKTYDAVVVIAKNIERMSRELAHRSKESWFSSLEPEHTKGESITEEMGQVVYERMDYLLASINTEFKALTKAREAHRMALEDEEGKAVRCGDCIFLHSPVLDCETHEQDEEPCPSKLLDIKFIDIEDPQAGRL
jgi:hypothetical protein